MVGRALASHLCDPGSVPVVRMRVAPRVFLRVLRFSSLHKNQPFLIPIRPGRQVFTYEPLAREIRRLLPTLRR